MVIFTSYCKRKKNLEINFTKIKSDKSHYNKELKENGPLKFICKTSNDEYFESYSQKNRGDKKKCK